MNISKIVSVFLAIVVLNCYGMESDQLSLMQDYRISKFPLILTNQENRPHRCWGFQKKKENEEKDWIETKCVGIFLRPDATRVMSLNFQDNQPIIGGLLPSTYLFLSYICDQEKEIFFVNIAVTPHQCFAVSSALLKEKLLLFLGEKERKICFETMLSRPGAMPDNNYAWAKKNFPLLLTDKKVNNNHVLDNCIAQTPNIIDGTIVPLIHLIGEERFVEMQKTIDALTKKVDSHFLIMKYGFISFIAVIGIFFYYVRHI